MVLVPEFPQVQIVEQIQEVDKVLLWCSSSWWLIAIVIMH